MYNYLENLVKNSSPMILAREFFYTSNYSLVWRPTSVQENWYTTFTLSVSTLWERVEKKAPSFGGLKYEIRFIFFTFSLEFLIL